MSNNTTSPKKKETNEEKLTKLLESQSKAMKRQEAAEKKTAKINEQIEAVRREIHNKEVSILDSICKDRNISYDEICKLLDTVTIPIDEMLSVLTDYMKDHAPESTEKSVSTLTEEDSKQDKAS